MVGTAVGRLDELSDQVGHGTLEVKVVIDQVYAHYQHEGLDLDHPRGGNAEFLRRPLYSNSARYMRTVAEGLLEDVERAAVDVAEDLVRDAAEQTPREFDDLIRSGHPIVTSDGATVYDRAPEQARLSESELREKERHRAALGLRRGHRQHIPEDVKQALRDLREKRRKKL